MNRHELDALLQGALDRTLTAEEQARLSRLISESADARDRAAQFERLAGLINSLGQANAPLGLTHNIVAEISQRPHAIRPSTFPRGVAVNKKILFGLAAAAAIVLAVITYYSNPPATVGTEATIGAAQRAQAPQIAANDVKLGDTASQDVLQTETFDAIMKDADVRTALQNAELRSSLQDEALRNALQDDAVRAGLRNTNLARYLADPNFARGLSDPELMKKFDDANLHAMLSNTAFRDALKNQNFRTMLARPGYAAALASPAMQQALRDKGFRSSLSSPAFAARLSAGVRAQ